MANVPSEIADGIWSLNDPSEVAEIGRIAAEAGRNVSCAEAVWDIVEMVAKEAAAAGNHARLAAMWRLVDRTCKESEVLTQSFATRLVEFASAYPIPMDAAEYAFFAQLLEGFKALFGASRMAIVSVKLRAQFAAKGGATTATANATVAGGGADGSTIAFAKQGPGAGQLTASVRTVGGFTAQRANNARPEGAQHALMVKTRDSLQAVRAAALYAPLVPVEMAIAAPVRDADADAGFMQPLPADHVEKYRSTRAENLKRMAEVWREQRELQQQGRAQPRPEHKTNAPAFFVDTFADVKMPTELPRDEFGVKMGNYPAGVRFLREAVRTCGGALELSLLEERVSQMADREALAEFGNLRQFIQIHKPTFRVAEEHDKWVVRLADDPIPEPSDEYSWERIACSKCSKFTKGRNLARHDDSRKCIDVQTALGVAGRPTTAIGELAYAARNVLERVQEGTLDDDDVSYFADCVHRAASVPRYREGSWKRFTPILKALRVLRDQWLSSKQATDMQKVVITEEDGPYCALFAAFAANMRRLPVNWIDTGDIVDMGRRFCKSLLQPFPPAPRPGDPRIRINNKYPGFMFAESGSDDDDKISSEEEEFSDDEAEQYEFAPPVTTMETMMAAGIERETKRINFRLRTAPPIPAAVAVKQDGTRTVADVYAAKSSGQGGRR